MRAYHFTGPTLRNGQPIPPIGEWLEHIGKIIPCWSGLHASEHPFDALQHAPGDVLHLVELEGEIQTHGDPVDKVVGRRRKILASVNAETLLRDFAKWCALAVAHLWESPPFVLEFLHGDESKRAVARAAAWDAAWDAAKAVAWDAAWGVARTAAWGATRAAQRAKFKLLVDAAFAAKEEPKDANPTPNPSA